MLIRNRFQVAAGAFVLGMAFAGYCAAGLPDSGEEARVQTHGIAPSSIMAEHKELHEALGKVIASGGRTAAEGRNVERLLQPHFAKEERFALPPLVVLPDLASGRVPPNAVEIARMATVLQDDMPAMLAEHRAIGQALDRLHTAALDERKPQAAAFVAHLKAHAKQEEEIFYPAAILAGRYLKLQRR